MVSLATQILVTAGFCCVDSSDSPDVKLGDNLACSLKTQSPEHNYKVMLQIKTTDVP